VGVDFQLLTVPSIIQQIFVAVIFYLE